MADGGAAPPGAADTAAGPAGGTRARWRRLDDAAAAPILDLTDVDEVTTTLLAPPSEFFGVRRRVVDQFTLLSANRAKLARSWKNNLYGDGHAESKRPDEVQWRWNRNAAGAYCW